MSNALIRRSAVLSRTGLPTSTLYEKIRKGEFPRPISIGARSVAWVEADVDAWVEAHIQASRGPEHGKAA